jgi:hypothetical protein
VPVNAVEDEPVPVVPVANDVSMVLIVATVPVLPVSMAFVDDVSIVLTVPVALVAASVPDVAAVSPPEPAFSALPQLREKTVAANRATRTRRRRDLMPKESQPTPKPLPFRQPDARRCPPGGLFVDLAERGPLEATWRGACTSKPGVARTPQDKLSP